MFLDQLQKRRSIRKYTSQPITLDQIEIIKEAVLRSPSSKSRAPWEFILVQDKDMLGKFAKTKSHGSSFLAKASLAVVVIANPEVSDVWIEDSAIASILMQLTAESIGLGSCWIQVRKRPHNEEVSAEKYLSNLLEIPDNFKILSIIGFGHPNEIKPPHPKSKLNYTKIHLEKY